MILHNNNVVRSGPFVLLTILLICALPAQAEALPTQAEGPVVADGVAYLTTGKVFCRTDGTREGTRCFDAGAQLSDPVTLHGKAYALAGYAGIVAFDGEHAPQHAVAFRGDGSWLPTSLISNGNHIFYLTRRFVVSDGFHLMRSDGTDAGTSLVQTLATTESEIMGSAGDFILLRARDTSRWKPFYNWDLWSSDGTSASPILAGETADRPVQLGGLMLFSTRSNKLWRTDGTQAGTYALHNKQWAYDVTVKGRYAYFTHEQQVWRTDGTNLHSLRKLDFPAVVTGPAGPRLCLLEKTQDTLVVWGADDTYGEPATLARIPSETRQEELSMAVTDRLAFFFAGANAQPELWRSDGTIAGTFRVATFRYGYHGLTALGDKVIFFANDGQHGSEPWVSDGTPAGTFMLANATRDAIVRGTVTDAATGLPLRDVIVESWFPDGLHYVRTDGDGRYMLEVAPGHHVYLRARTNKYVTSTADSLYVGPDKDVTLDFALEAGGRIAGRVVDSTGKPLPGMTVNVTVDSGWQQTLISGDTGRFLTDPLPAGKNWSVQAQQQRGHNDGIVTGAGVAAGETVETELTMKEFGRLRIRLLDAVTQGPARMTREGSATVHRTESNFVVAFANYEPGNPIAEVALPDGDYNIAAEPSAYRKRWYGGISCLDSYCYPPFDQRGTVVHCPGATTTTIDLVLDPRGSSVRGVVLDAESGARLSDVDIRVEAVDRGYYGTTTRTRNGSFETEPYLADGTVLVHAAPPLYSQHLPASAEVVLDFAKNPRPEVELRLERGGTLHGRVVDQDGKAIQFARIDIAGQYAFTDRTGGYTIAGIISGTYEVNVTRTGYDSARVDGVVVTKGAKTKVDLTMSPKSP